MKRFMIIFIFAVLLFSNTVFAGPMVKGIYLTQSTLEDTTKLNYLIQHAKAAGITAFIIDLEIISKRYAQNIQLVKNANIKYIARIIMFPDGGTPDKVKSPDYWKRKYALVKYAVDNGASRIQLDYIRYNTKQPASSQNAKDIYQIIHWYKEQLASQNIPLEVDVFGISSFGEAKNIGQSIKLFSSTVDAICPMVYPSHFVPFKEHAATPYETVYDSLIAIKDQFDEEKLPFQLVPYIELSNYHYQLSQRRKLEYIHAQILAAEKAGADGWYAWSPHNQYDNLFRVLETYPVQ